MTDRYYPCGLPAEEDAFKTTYEIQNEMESHARSAYPPGYAGFEPGTRDKFGYSTPGPIASRLSHSELAQTEGPDIFEPRRVHATSMSQVADEGDVFDKLDLPSLHQSMGSTGAKTLLKASSTPSLKPPPPPLNMAREPICDLEDAEHCYFVPQGMQKLRQETIVTNRPYLSKLSKADMLVHPFGDGTGFKSQCPIITWFPAEQMEPTKPKLDSSTAYRDTFPRPPFYRMSPMGMRKEITTSTVMRRTF